MRDICICLMCGIPGSGKTTLCQLLEEHRRFRAEYDTLLVHYDDLLPSNSQRPKADRTKLYHAVSRIVYDLQRFHGDIGAGGDGGVSVNPGITADVVTSRAGAATDGTCPRPDRLFGQDGQCDVDSGHSTAESRRSDVNYERLVQRLRDPFSAIAGGRKPVAILIDDNMYYESMRQPYYALARRSRCGYCVCHLAAEESVALSRNSTRPRCRRVEDAVVRRMSEVLEPPPANFERNYAIINARDFNTSRSSTTKSTEPSSAGCAASTLSSTSSLIRETINPETISVLLDVLKMALQAATAITDSVTAPSTRQSLPDTLRQRCDITLRRLVAKQLSSATTPSPSCIIPATTARSSTVAIERDVNLNETRQKLAKRLSVRKGQLLQLIRGGEISGLKDSMTTGELYTLLERHLLFDLELIE